MDARDKKKEISRRKFLQTLGSVIAGGTIVAVTGTVLGRRLTNKREAVRQASGQSKAEPPASPYRLTSAFKVPDLVENFDIFDNKIIAAIPNSILTYDLSGRLINNFAVGSNVRNIAVDSGLIYLLFPSRVEVYSLDGEFVRDFKACSEQSDYCSIALAEGSVFVTDVANKNICQYTSDGNFVRFIESPNGFVIPSYTMDIAYTNGLIYCSNSGRHQVETYTPEGKYVGAFGRAGGSAGSFGGCCNPARLAVTTTGDIITSEKGVPRISCYSAQGEFRTILLDGSALNAGNKACEVRAHNDKLLVANKDVISVFSYDKAVAANSACASCAAACPLKDGVII